MMSHNGKCRIDGVSIGEVTINLLETQPVLTAKYALVNTALSTRFGAGTRGHWSLETFQRLSQLIEAMERDCASDIFEDASTTILSGMESFQDTSGNIPSL